MYRYSYVGFLDIDELLTVADGRTVKQLLTDLDEPKYCSFNFKPRWFLYDGWDINATSFTKDMLLDLSNYTTFTRVTIGRVKCFLIIYIDYIDS